MRTDCERVTRWKDLGYPIQLHQAGTDRSENIPNNQGIEDEHVNDNYEKDIGFTADTEHD